MGTYSIRRGKQSGYSIKDRVNCHPCPVGGNCSYSLAAQPNFWGYPGNNDTVTFQLCPEGTAACHLSTTNAFMTTIAICVPDAKVTGRAFFAGNVT